MLSFASSRLLYVWLVVNGGCASIRVRVLLVVSAAFESGAADDTHEVDARRRSAFFDCRLRLHDVVAAID